MATVEDLENTKSALVAMRREKLLFQQEHDRSLAELGLDSSATANLVITSSNQLTLPTPVGYPQLPNHEADVLQAEIDAFESLAAATRSEDMPRLSLYGLLQHDDAGGSEFGGARTLNGYEAGLVLRWDIWDGGANRSKAKKIEFLKMAKEAELKTQRLRASRGTGLAANSLKLSKANLQSLDELVEHQASILKVIETSYKEGGEASYMKMINAFLIYESQVRQQVYGRFDHINKQTDLYASHAGWTPGLIEALDRMFTSSR
jgi:outer membrane protein TolC